MLTDRTLIVEMTGIMGAGYLPNLFKPLTEMLRKNYYTIGDDGNAKKIITRYVIDNTELYKHNPELQTRLIEDLVNNIRKLSKPEWDEMVKISNENEAVIKQNLELYKEPIDIIFRRGGRLQDYVVLNGTNWEKNSIHRLSPKLQFYLKADLEVIRRTYQEHTVVQEVIRDYPTEYIKTPEGAFKSQEEILQQVKGLPGLKYIERHEIDTHDFAKSIIKEIIPVVNYFGLKTRPKRTVFISYSHEDSCFAEKLYQTLISRNIGAWIDKKELLVGDSVLDKIANGIDSADFLCALISNNSINSKWVKQELNIAMHHQIANEKIKVLPLLLQSNVRLPSFLIDTKYLDFSEDAKYDENIEYLIRRITS